MSYEELEARLDSLLERLSSEDLSLEETVDIVETATEAALECVEAVNPS